MRKEHGMKIVLTGGGTAGHVSGNMALVPHLKKQGFDIEYIGSVNGMEKDIVAKDPDIIYHGIPSGGLNRYFTWRNFRNVFRVARGISAASRLIKQIKPDVVFSKGGFVTVPVVIAAHRNNIPVLIHESDITPGLANKIASKFADKICTTFPETVEYFPQGKAFCTGSPIRGEIYLGNKQTGLKLCGFEDEKPCIIVMGGSTGAAAVNKLVWDSLDALLPRFNVIHICGKDGCDPKYDGIKGYKQFGYVTDQLCHLLELSDVAISRAGSNAIFEFLAMAKPMVLIPLPKDVSRGDQVVNAQSFQKQGFAVACDQYTLTPEELTKQVNDIYDRRAEIKASMNSTGLLNGTDNIMEMILKAVGK